MNSLIDLLEGFEKLAYKLLLWVILIPKTIGKIILNPGFAPDYIHDELENDKDSPFDEYISPMLLYLGVTLLPAVMVYLIPVFGVSISSPLDEDSNLYHQVMYEEDDNTKVAGHVIELKVDATLKGDTSVLFHEFRWVVFSCGNLDTDGYCQYDLFVGGQIHDESLGVAKLTSESDMPAPESELWSRSTPAGFKFEDRNTVSDTLVYGFPPDAYYVKVYGGNSESPSSQLIEEYIGEIYLYVPENSEEYEVYNFNPSEGKKNQKPDWEELLKSGWTLLLGLALLLPPLLFAVVINFFREKDKVISETDLKESFYVQCYYFAPVGLAYWAWSYSYDFHTEDMLLTQDILIYPLLVALMWFVGVEINATARLLQSKSKIKAFLIVVGCVCVTVFFVILGLQFLSNYNQLRESAICSYPLIGVLFLALALFGRIRVWRKARNSSNSDSGS